MNTIYVFGNEYLEDDGFAGRVAAGLCEIKSDVNIVHCTSPDDLLEAGANIIILDVVKNIKEPVLIDDISQIKTNKLVTMHDFDLGFYLKLMKELDDEKNVKIIGVPTRGNALDIAKKVSAWL